MSTATTTTATPKADADVTKTGNTVTARFTLKNLPTLPQVDVAEVRKPLFAVVGVADLALEQVKDVPADVTARTLAAQGKLQELVAEVPTQVKTLPTTARVQAEKAQQRATELYAALAVRGERLVTSIRRQPATEAAIAEGKEAVRKAEAAATAARKAAKAGEKAVEGAAAKIG